jgi:hypothetical protein
MFKVWFRMGRKWPKFATMPEAVAFAEEVFQKRGIVVAITKE